ncbi:MAG: hypothetical protein JNK05_11815 [Myxococcales bacterium]|nr:hypothetical protein [Myxococcales bacterium]
MNLLHCLVLRRRALLLALRLLDPISLKLLVALALRADPRTGRDWLRIETIAEDLRLLEEQVAQSLERLRSLGFLEQIPTHGAWRASVELGAVLVREPRPPENLPLAPV